MDRIPRSYAFMNAGYSAAIIGFPSVLNPDLLFDTPPFTTRSYSSATITRAKSTMIGPTMHATRTQQKTRHRHQAKNNQADELQACLRRCQSLVNEGLLEQASAMLAPALQRFHGNPWILALHGKVLLQLGRPAPAMGALTLALDANPGNPETLSDIVLAHLALGQPSEALPHAIEALHLLPDGPRSVNLSCVLINLGAYAEALGFAEHALTLQPDHLEALGNRALALEGLGRYQEAIDAGRIAVALAPDHPSICHNQAVIELTAGRLTPAAWDLYEWRLQLKRHKLPWSAKLIRWEGEDIRGKTILLHAEQGIGDTLQFARYAPLVAARGARVILVVQSTLFRLLQNIPGVDELLAVGDELPTFDVYCPLLSLPRIFGTTLDTIPPLLPYSATDPEAAAGRYPASSTLRVGLVWAGSRDFIADRLRSLPLSDLSVLAGIEGVQFYGLQHGSAETPLPPLQITDLMRSVQDFADTATWIAGLDLVIAVDTGVAHLAAAMGRPVWLLSRFRGCWRWLHDRTDSPWYPTLRLYRQQQPNDWQDPLQRIRTDLAALAARRSPRPQPPTAETPTRSCKVCGAASPAFGSVDFNKTCEDRRGAPSPPAGRPITYHRCPSCALMFTGAFDHWTHDDFRREIYNEGYAAADPDYAVKRPSQSLDLLHALFGKACKNLDMLDYGGGDGKLAALLASKHGGKADIYDPFNPQHDVPPLRTYRLLTCFEVLEHCTDPANTIAQMARLLHPDGIIVFSTLLHPPDFMRHGLTWWYAAPRNGHVTLFSAEALKQAWAQAGFAIQSYTSNLHIAFREASGFASPEINQSNLLERARRWAANAVIN